MHHQAAMILLWDDDEVFSFEQNIDEPRDVSLRRFSVASRRNISVVVPSCEVCFYKEKITGLILRWEERLTNAFLNSWAFNFISFERNLFDVDLKKS